MKFTLPRFSRTRLRPSRRACRSGFGSSGATITSTWYPTRIRIPERSATAAARPVWRLPEHPLPVRVPGHVDQAQQTPLSRGITSLFGLTSIGRRDFRRPGPAAPPASRREHFDDLGVDVERFVAIVRDGNVDALRIARIQVDDAGSSAMPPQADPGRVSAASSAAATGNREKRAIDGFAT